MTCPHDIIEKDNACADGMCPICLAAEIELVRRSTEPARGTAYRRLYERIHTQDDCISWLLATVRVLQRRVDKIEQHNAHTAANMIRAAYKRLEDELSTPP